MACGPTPAQILEKQNDDDSFRTTVILPVARLLLEMLQFPGTDDDWRREGSKPPGNHLRRVNPPYIIHNILDFLISLYQHELLNHRSPKGLVGYIYIYIYIYGSPPSQSPPFQCFKILFQFRRRQGLATISVNDFQTFRTSQSAIPPGTVN